MFTRNDKELEYEADQLLSTHDCFGTENGIYREADISRKIITDNAKAIASGQDLDWNELVILDGYNEPPRVSIAEIIEAARLTPRQRYAVRLMIELRSQTAVSRVMSIQKSAVSKLLYRAFIKVHLAYPKLQEREPLPWVWQLWYEEMRHKRRLIYRKNITRKK